VAPDHQAVDGGVVVGCGGREQRFGDGHRQRRAEQRDPLDVIGVAGGGIERHQRTHAVSDQCGAFHAGGIEQRDDPVGQGLDAGQRFTPRATVTGEVEGEHRPPVAREVACRERPHGVVHRRAVDEDERRTFRIERAAAGGGVDGVAVDGEFHK
jgi:hypothetical protein